MLRIFSAALAASIISFAPAAFADEATDAEPIQVAQNDTSDSQEVAENETVADDDRVVCRRIRVTGSIRSQRVCMTQAQWTAESERGRQSIENQNSLDRNNTNTVGQQ